MVLPAAKNESLKPFWRYYGGKWRAAPRYPAPKYRTIIEPFAGSAGYSLRYPHYDIVLVEAYPVIAEIWRYLISVNPDEILRIPCVDHVDDLPTWVPQGGRYLVGFCMNDASVAPAKRLSSGKKWLRSLGNKTEGWSEARRERVAAQVPKIRHWKIIEGDYTQCQDIEATWFIDPPYNNKAGSYYIKSDIDYEELAMWCQSRQGQVMVCENEGATWLPFQTFATLKAGLNGKGSKEVLWQNTQSSPTH